MDLPAVNFGVRIWWVGFVAIAAVAMGGSFVHAQTTEDFEQLRRIIEQQQKQLDEALRVIEQQRRDQEDQTRQIETLQEQVKALAPPSRRELLLPPGIEGGPLTPEEAKELLVQPSRISPDPPKDAAYTISVGGHINRQVSTAADGNQTKTYFVDSNNVPTFAYIKGKSKVNEDLELGAHLEVALQNNPAASVSQTNESAGFTTSGRFAEITADSKTYGKGWFGKGFASSFITAETDKSGTQFGNLASVGNAFPGLLFYSDDLGDYSDFTVGDAFVDAQGLQLINRVRYDTPVWNGFRLGGDFGEDQFAAGSIRYSEELGDFSLSSALTYQNNGIAGADWRQDGGVGLLHKPSGLNLSGGYSVLEFKDDGRHSNGFIIRPGWRGKLIDWGETRTAVDFTRVWDITENGDSATSAGAFIVQVIDDFGMQLYLGYRYYDLDRDDIDLDDIHLITTGVSVPFDFELSFDRDGKVLLQQ